ncbi:hypothetical protein E2C01_048122 [Portunus trituberculatus]|uniref:Uncharacterized protein n=1 Tax=Portunus trituberculatus TaxID=210409 RepID=A0A5B7GCD9_PORTR|nr:hypothetical protein [Portunus trituberculatus]
MTGAGVSTCPSVNRTCRVQKIIDSCEQLIRKSREKIRKVTRVIGLLVAAIPAVELGKLHYRQLEMEKITALQTEKVPLNGNIKQCRPQFKARMIKFQAYPKDASLCVCVTLWQYLQRTEALRQGTVQEPDY